MKSNSFNFNSDNTFCISLLSNTERCVKMERRFKKLNLYQRRFETAPLRGAIVQTATGNLVEGSSAERIEIFNGVNQRRIKSDPADLDSSWSITDKGVNVTIWPASTPDDLTDNFVGYLNNLSRACAQSHWNIWKHIINNNIEYALILEDDACFDKLFFEKLNQFWNDVNDNEWDCIFLNASEESSPTYKWVLAHEQYLTGGYILSKHGVNKLFNMYSNCLHTSDWMTSRLQLFNHSYTYFPWLIIQEGKESTIGSSVDADHEKVVRLLGEIDYSLENYDI